MRSHKARSTRDRSISHSLQIWVSTKSSIPQLTFFKFIIIFKVNSSTCSQQELLLSCCFFDHRSSNINKLWLLLCYLRVSFHQLASPPGFHVAHIPKGNLAYTSAKIGALRAPYFPSLGCVKRRSYMLMHVLRTTTCTPCLKQVAVKYLMTVHELAELTPIGCGPLASRTPINNGAPWGGVSTLCGAISTHGTTVFVSGLLEL